MGELQSFLDARLGLFEHDRAKVDRNSTSRLSPWLHSGTLSVRYLYYRVRTHARMHPPTRPACTPPHLIPSQLPGAEQHCCWCGEGSGASGCC